MLIELNNYVHTGILGCVHCFKANVNKQTMWKIYPYMSNADP